MKNVEKSFGSQVYNSQNKNRLRGEDDMIGKIGIVRESAPGSFGVVFKNWHGGHGLTDGKYTVDGGWYFDPDALKIARKTARKTKKVKARRKKAA